MIQKHGWSRCQTCREVFQSKEIRKDHENKAHEHERITCDMCKELLPSYQTLAGHVASKHCPVDPGNYWLYSKTHLHCV